jgi:hypothetical protein
VCVGGGGGGGGLSKKNYETKYAKPICRGVPAKELTAVLMQTNRLVETEIYFLIRSVHKIKHDNKSQFQAVDKDRGSRGTKKRQCKELTGQIKQFNATQCQSESNRKWTGDRHAVLSAKTCCGRQRR